MKLIVTTFISLDGVMQGPGGADEDRSNGFERGGWVIPLTDDEFGGIVVEWMSTAEALLLGRTTFELFSSFWPQVTDPADPIAAKLNTAPKYVASNTLTEADWGQTTILSGDLVEQVSQLKAEGDGELQVHGSAGLVQTLNRAGLVDEYRIMIVPVIVGGGKRLFEDGAQPSGLTLVSSRTTGTGITAQVYRPSGELVVATAVIDDGKETVG